MSKNKICVACGICSLSYEGIKNNIEPEIIISYDSIKKRDEDVSCEIRRS